MAKFSSFTIAALLLSAQSAICLTSGPNQPEYIGFKSSTQKDMVDLKTGDFGYALPVMELPGPSFSYPLTLGYHSGIMLEQEASWVGLGWSLNPGAINRGLNRFPDDYYRGHQKSTFKGTKDIDNYRLGVIANVSWSEAGDISAGVDLYLFSATASYSPWQGFTASGGIFGMEFGYNNRTGIGFQETPDFMQALTYMITVGTMEGGTEGPKDPTAPAFEGITTAGVMSIGMSLKTAYTYATEYDFSLKNFFSRSVTTGAIKKETKSDYIIYSEGTTSIDKTEDRKLYGYLNLGDFPRETSEERLLECTHKIFNPTGPPCYVPEGEDQPNWETRHHRMEFDWAVEDNMKADKIDAPGIPTQVAQMLNNFGRKNSWAVSTQDGFMVKAEGVGFGFRSYRQDLGDYYAESGVTAQTQNVARRIVADWSGARTLAQRRNKYDIALGEYASRFYKEEELDPNADPAKRETALGDLPVAVFREAGDIGGTFESEDWPDKCTGGECPGFLGEHRYLYREHREYAGHPVWDEFVRDPKMPAHPDRISGSKGVFPKFKQAYPTASAPVCQGVRNPDIPECDPLVPIKALIGFTFVRPDGMVYEYNRPAFNWIQKSASVDRPDDKDREDQWGHYDFGRVKATNSLERPYAYAWLITSVKAPDYVDKNGDGKGSKGDLGGWVRFEYGTTLKNYHWRSPYEGATPLATGEDMIVYGNKDDPNSDPGNDAVIMNNHTYGSASWGVKEIHFLSGIFSETHQVKFVLSDRDDGLQANIEESGEGFTLESDHLHFRSPYIRPKVGDRLKLGSAIIRVTAVADPAVNATTCPAEASFANHVCNGNGRDIRTTFVVESGAIPSSPSLKLFESDTRLKKLDRMQLYENHSDNGTIDGDESMLREVRFDYGYDLAPGIPNHVNAGPGTIPNGKLTLRKVAIGDGQTFFPPYEFKYVMEGDQARYHQNHWDRWGFYKANGGLERSEFDMDDVIRWQNMHDKIKETEPTDFLTALFRANLGPDLAPIVAAATLTDAMKESILGAMTKTTKNLDFYAQNMTVIGQPSALTGRSKKLFDLLVANDIFDDLGNLKAGPKTIEDTNKVEWFNNSVVDREYGKGETADPGFDILRKVNANRFDHEPSKDDVMAWSLNKIHMPSGGVLEVEYESDDYAYEGRAKVVRVEKRKVDSETGEAKFFKSIGMEKSLNSVSNVMEINEENFGENIKERADQIEVRVESVFRLYRQVAGTNGLETQINDDFRHLHKRHYNPKTVPNVPPASDLNPFRDENGLHLVAWFIPPSNTMYVDVDKKSRYNGGSCGVLPIWSNSRMPLAIPVDLGQAQEAFEYHGSDANVIPTSWPEEKFCQRNWVTFKLSKLLSANFQGKSGTNTCPTDILGWRYYLTWSRKRDIDLPASVPGNLNEWVVDWKNPGGTLKINDARTTEWAYDALRGSTPPVRHGNWAWYDLHEFTAYRQDQPEDANTVGVFKKGFWDFYNVNTYVAAPATFVGEAAGLIGGGVRAKRTILHSGWAQKPGAPAQVQVAEYAYDGAGGFGGTYTSGSTPAIPPPYNNKGDDRRLKSASEDLIQKGPGVIYRTVAVIRPGMGRTVNNFLTSADVGDFWNFEPCNAEPRGCNGFTDDVGGFQRWKLHRVSHFQGTPTGAETFDEKGKSLGKTELKYQVSLDRVQLGQLNELSVVNNSDAMGGEFAFVPTVTVTDQTGETHQGTPLNAGVGQFGLHTASDKMGKTVSRYRHRYNWHFELGCTESESAAWCVMGDHGDGLDHPLSTMAVTEVEDVENSIHPFLTTRISDGVAVEEKISFFDFFTGTPLVSTHTPLGQGPVGDGRKQRPVRTDVKVPAYWIPEYNPPGTLPAMGSVYRDPKFRTVAIGREPASNLKHKNMLMQEFSESAYSGLSGYVESDIPAEFWRTKLDDKNLYRRGITLWEMLGATGEKAWRKTGNLAFRMDMGADKQLTGDSRDIRMPYPVPDATNPDPTVASYYWNPLYYHRTSHNTIVDAFGKTLETEDLNGNSSAFFYDRGLFTVGQVANARRKDARVLPVDEVRLLSGLPDGWTRSGPVDFHTEARSGTKSLAIGAGGSLGLSLPTVTGGTYELSFWVKRGSTQGNLTLNGTTTTVAPVSAGKQWQRISRQVTMAQDATLSLSIAAGSGSLFIDDVRVAPLEAQVYTMTYDKQGRISSQSGPNDIISYFNHDAFGRLVEVRDHEGLLISTQAQREARK